MNFDDCKIFSVKLLIIQYILFFYGTMVYHFIYLFLAVLGLR